MNLEETLKFEAKMVKLYFAIAEDHNLMFWQQGDRGYTFNQAYAKPFTDDQIFAKQLSDPYSQWSVLIRQEDFEKINIGGSKIWAIRATDDKLLRQFNDWCLENSPGHAALVHYERRNKNYDQ